MSRNRTKRANWARTEECGEGVVAARAATGGGGGPEVKTGADGDVAGTTEERVALTVAAARHRRPADRVERREVEADNRTIDQYVERDANRKSYSA